MSESITWTNCKMCLGDLLEWEDNPAEITQAAGERLAESFNEFGQIQTLAIDPDNRLIDGHQRKGVWIAKFGADFVVDCRRASRRLTQKERRKIAVYLRSGATGRYNWDKLSEWESDDLAAWGMDARTLQEWKTDVAALDNFLKSEGGESQNAEPQEILEEQWGVLIDCENEQEQVRLLERFVAEGLRCRALLS